MSVYKASGVVLGIIEGAVHWPTAFAVTNTPDDCNGAKTLL